MAKRQLSGQLSLHFRASFNPEKGLTRRQCWLFSDR